MKLFVYALIYMLFNKIYCEEHDKYPNTFNNFDVDAVLKNDKIMKNYIKCLLDEGPCTKEGRELKNILPDAVRTECSKCDEKQKTVSMKVFKVLNDKYPTYLDRLLKKYDPSGEHAQKLKEHISNENTTIAVQM